MKLGQTMTTRTPNPQQGYQNETAHWNHTAHPCFGVDYYRGFNRLLQQSSTAGLSWLTKLPAEIAIALVQAGSKILPNFLAKGFAR
jgi:hypothetical protein